MVDLSPYQSRINAAMRDQANFASGDPRSDFIKELIDEGFTPPKTLVVTGNIDRIDSPEDSRVGKLSGWYSYGEIESGDEIIGWGRYGSWNGEWSNQWSSKSTLSMNQKERVAYNEAQIAAREKAEQQKRVMHEEASIKAYGIWQDSMKPTGDEAYLNNKKITPCNLLRVSYNKYKCGELIVPLVHSGSITSVQMILNEGEYQIKGNSIGNKKMMSGGRSKGCYLYMQGDSDIVYICEGYATGRSISMATGNVVSVCFSTNNLYSAATAAKEDYPDSLIIICGDDDVNTKGNPGRTKAEQVGRALGMRVEFPADGGDFNDMHVDYGLKAVEALIKPKNIEEIRKELSDKEIVHNKDTIKRPGGVMGHIFDYYNATSGIYQPGFAIQTAITICSVILGRSYKTDQNNYTSLFLMNIGESSTGKEHIKKISEKILEQCNVDHLIGGDGFTSPGAVYTNLMRHPVQLSLIDEIGMYLKNCKEGGANTMADSVSILMQVITRNDGVLRARNYSAMSGGANKDDMHNRNIKNPALTLCGNTTQSTFYDTVDIEAVKSGFLNRFMIYQSDVDMQIWEDVPPVDLPDRIIDWVDVVRARHGCRHTFNEPSKPIIIPFSTEAGKLVREYKIWALEQQKELRKANIDKMAARLAEWSMRLSLIVALSRDPMTETVEAEDVEWAIYWSKLTFSKTLKSIRAFMVYSEHDKERDEVYKALIEYGSKGLPFKKMLHEVPPFKKHSRKKLSQILEELKEADLIVDSTPESNGRGKKSPIWLAL